MSDPRCMCGDPECPRCFTQEPRETEHDASDDRLLAAKEERP